MRLAAMALGALAMAGPAAAESLPVTLPADARIALSLEKSREENGQSATMRFEYEMRAEAQDAGRRVTWTFVKAEPDLPAGMGPVGEFMKLPIVYTAAPTLMPQRIENMDALMDQLTRSMSALGEKDPKAKQAVEQTLASFRQMDPETAAAVFMKDAAQVALGQGGEDLNVGEALEYEDQVANPLGGPPIKTRAAFTLDSYSAAEGKAVLTWRSRLDPESASASVRESLQAMATRMGRPTEGLQGLTLTRTDECRYEIALKTGLAETVKCSSRTESTDGKQSRVRVERLTARQKLLAP